MTKKHHAASRRLATHATTDFLQELLAFPDERFCFECAAFQSFTIVAAAIYGLSKDPEHTHKKLLEALTDAKKKADEANTLADALKSAFESIEAEKRDAELRAEDERALREEGDDLASADAKALRAGEEILNALLGAKSKRNG